jgi:4-amino-4-deoxy-L-arabinose transferase-like glycosyltransferase
MTPVESPRPRTAWILPGALTLACLASRIPGLMRLPIFCDEAIYLRYAQLIRRAPWGNALVSLVDPKPPLHYWLLAAVFGATSDPLLAGRLLSVAVGLATTLLVIPLCQELTALSPPPRSKAPAGSGSKPTDLFTLFACLLFLSCPFLAFYQRMALAEALLVAETILVTWLSLRLARDPSRGAMVLGLALGSALLTKQVFSYTLAALPLTAAALWWRELGVSSRRSLLSRLAGAFALALLLFSPVLVFDYGPDLKERVFFHASHRKVSGLTWGRERIAADNLRYVFVPGVLHETSPEALYEGFQAPADTGWLWISLTPPIYLASLAGLAALAFRQRWRLFLYLGVWIAAMLVPFVGFATSAVPRYALFAVPPFLLAAAWLLAAAAGRVATRARPGAAAALLIAFLLWPARSIWLQCTDPARQPLTRSDSWQYVSGWPAGTASRAAVDALEAMAARGPLVVVTSSLVGTPNDVTWTYLDGRSGLRLYYVPWAFRAPLLREQGSPGTLLLFTGFHGIRRPGFEVAFRPGVPVVYVGMDPYPRSHGGPVPASQSVLRLNPGLAEIARFENPPTPGISHKDAVVLYRLR